MVFTQYYPFVLSVPNEKSVCSCASAEVPGSCGLLQRCWAGLEQLGQNMPGFSAISPQARVHKSVVAVWRWVPVLGEKRGRRKGARMGTSPLLVPIEAPDVIFAVVLPGTSVTAGLPFFGWLHFPERSRKFGISACVWPFPDLGVVCKFTPVCSLNCWLTAEERRGLIPGFWSWMKLAYGKAKHSLLRYVFLTWNQLALHK